MAICAIATAQGKGGIAVIRVSGHDAFDIVNRLLTTPNIEQQTPRMASYKHIYNLNKELLDDAVLTTFHAPHSFTGENTVEIAVHGSTYIQQEVLKTLIAAGATMAAPGEFTQRAFLNGKMDLAQAEAVADIIAAESKAMHRVAANQMRGGVSHKLQALREQLLELTSLMELELDFADHEELEFADRSQVLDLSRKLLKEINDLANTFHTGNAIKKGIAVAIIGKPNVGKSTLLNALLKEERAIVTDIPGTTRDTIEGLLDIDGLTYRLIDTAGIHETADEVESIGIQRAYQQIETADITLWLADEQPSEADFEDIRRHCNGRPLITISTKSDLHAQRWSFPETLHISLSAKTGEGIDALLKALRDAVEIPDLANNEVILTNVRHYESLCHAAEATERVIAALEQQIPSDLITLDLRDVLHHLGLITGEITTQDVLHNIFSKFCIGK